MHKISLLAVLLCCMAHPSTNGANRYWDTDGGTAGLQAGSGLGWDTGINSSWSTTATGTALTIWANNDTAFFQTAGVNAVTLTGTIIANAVTQTVNSTVTTLTGGTLQIDTNAGIANTTASSTFTINSAIVLNSSNIIFNAGATITVGGAVSELAIGSSLTKTGDSVLNLNGANTYTGTTNINGGLLRFGTASSVPGGAGSIIINNGGTLAASGPTGTTNFNTWLSSGRIATSSTGALGLTASSTGSIDLMAAGYHSLYLGSTTSVTYSGTLTPGSNGYLLGGYSTLTVSSALNVATTMSIGGPTGSGTVILTNANGYTGLTTVGAGSVLRITNGNALGTTAAGTVVSSGGRLELSSTTGITTPVGESLTISGPGGNNIGALQNQSGNNVWAGSVILGANNTRIGVVAGSLDISGVIDDGANTFNLAIRNNAGNIPITLSNVNTYGGNTDIVVGIVMLGINNALPFTAVTLGNGSMVGSSALDLNGRSQEVPSLAAASGNTVPLTNLRVINSSATAGSLTINNSAAVNSTVFYGNTGQDNFSITKQGVGTLTLTQVNTYTGATTINQGTFALGAAASIDNSATITVASGATFNVSAVTGGYTLKSGQTLEGAGTVTGGATATTLNSGSFLAPGTAGGDATARLTLTNGLIMATGSTTNIEITNATFTSMTNFDGHEVGSAEYNTYVLTNAGAGTFGADHDQVNVTGNLTQNAGAKINVLPLSFTPVNGQIFNLFDWTGTFTASAGDFTAGMQRDGSTDNGTDLDLPDISGSGYMYDLSLFASDGIIVVIVPEPGRAVLLLAGLGALLIRRRRRGLL